MSTLQVSNLHFESTGNNRLQYTGSNSYNLVAGGSTVAVINTSSFYANLNFDVAGTFKVNNTDISTIGQQTIWVPAAAMYPRTSNGASFGIVETSTNKVILYSLDYDAAALEYSQFAIQMPKGWNEGTLICQFVWSHPATTTNFGVVWGIQSVAFDNDNAADTAFGTAVTVIDTGGSTNDIYISPEASAMTVAGSPGPEEYVVFQVYRDAPNGSDTLAVDARLHGLKIHYTIDAGKDD